MLNTVRPEFVHSLLVEITQAKKGLQNSKENENVIISQNILELFKASNMVASNLFLLNYETPSSKFH